MAKGEVRDSMANRETALTVIVIVLLGTTGLAGLAAAHGDNTHQPTTNSASSQYEIGPIEGPGDPDGSGPAPYTFQAIIFTQCGPVYDLASECVQNGGAVFEACDSWRHSRVGGRARFDLPCSDGDPYDHLSVDISARLDLGRQIPFVITQCGPDDTLCGEAEGGDVSNDGQGTFDEFPGPKEMDIDACTDHGSSADITIPEGEGGHATFGTGDGVVTQAGQTYTTHHRGTDISSPDNVAALSSLSDGEVKAGMVFEGFTHTGDISEVPHPGIESFAIFIRGAIHGPSNAPCDASAINTLQGDIVVDLS